MVPNVLPNWVRLALSIAAILSYLPQYHCIQEQGHSNGLSLYYVLFGLLSATEHLTLGLLLNITEPRSGAFVETPATVGDWINLVQLGVVWLCALILFILSIRRSSATFSYCTTVTAIFVAVFSVSVVPVIAFAVTPKTPVFDHQRILDVFMYTHYLVFLPSTSILIPAAIIPQAREVLRRQYTQRALSLPCLASQAVVFAFLAISWMIRVNYPPYSPSWEEWYRLVGWPVVNDALSSFSQGVLLLIAVRHTENVEFEHAERRPLLHVSGN
ncbi:hypothetical protein C8035_v006617 [Colletotrichum spinosum]|uniref:Uncharacterized protein n=1 Tax=Colletotrichum spinosum TaxID=1347390 RepID=A0A4V6QEL1_9PEZI|nr:hypothetical protein C8035_v006617 [Colletotrichum spinosum]